MTTQLHSIAGILDIPDECLNDLIGCKVISKYHCEELAKLSGYARSARFLDKNIRGQSCQKIRKAAELLEAEAGGSLLGAFYKTCRSEFAKIHKKI